MPPRHDFGASKRAKCGEVKHINHNVGALSRMGVEREISHNWRLPPAESCGFVGRERDLHAAVMGFLAVALPPHSANTTFPAGGGGRVRGAMLKKIGLDPGWPDIQIIYDGQYYGVELKNHVGRISDAQARAHEAIRDAGGCVCVCRSVREVELFLREHGIPLKARAS